MILDTPLRSRRLLLRTLAVDDATERYLGWMRDPETTRYLEARLVEHSLQSLHEYIESCAASPTELLLGICLPDGEHIGNIKLGPIDSYHRRAAVGLLIGEREQRGMGYATEAIVAVTARAFGAMTLEKLYAGCYASNIGSARAFLKAGWSEEGRSKAAWRADDGREDNIALGITLADWSALRQ
ncbi:MAG: GNAT family N-acetyltransferase [Chloroflexota bacterium]